MSEVICVIFGLNCVTVHASSPPAETGGDVRGAWLIMCNTVMLSEVHLG